MAFLQYLLSRLTVGYDADSVGMEDIIHRCRRSNMFGEGDERMIIKMSMLYATLSYYQEGFDGSSDELLLEIPVMCEFIEKFMGLQTVMPASTVGIEAML